MNLVLVSLYQPRLILAGFLEWMNAALDGSCSTLDYMKSRALGVIKLIDFHHLAYTKCLKRLLSPTKSFIPLVLIRPTRYPLQNKQWWFLYHDKKLLWFVNCSSISSGLRLLPTTSRINTSIHKEFLMSISIVKWITVLVVGPMKPSHGNKMYVLYQ